MSQSGVLQQTSSFEDVCGVQRLMDKQQDLKAYAFNGRHLLASYLSCDPKALNDHAALLEIMKKGIEATGAQLLSYLKHEFNPQGFAVVMLLSESHATIHTYPEHAACFVDIFTCGDHCKLERFDLLLRQYLQPKATTSKIFSRREKIEEETCLP